MPGHGPCRYVRTTLRSPPPSEPISTLPGKPARCATSHSVMASAMPPLTVGPGCAPGTIEGAIAVGAESLLPAPSVCGVCCGSGAGDGKGCGGGSAAGAATRVAAQDPSEPIRSSGVTARAAVFVRSPPVNLAQSGVAKTSESLLVAPVGVVSLVGVEQPDSAQAAVKARSAHAAAQPR